MSSTSHVTIWCDFGPCDNWIDYGASTATETRKIAKYSGWMRQGGKDYCCQSHADGRATHMENLQAAHAEKWSAS